MNDENECRYDLPYRRLNQNKHEGVKMRGILPTEVVKPQAEAPIKCGTLKALSLRHGSSHPLKINNKLPIP